MASRIGPISPVGAITPAWSAARGLPTVVVPPPVVPPPAAAAGPVSAPGLLASMAPALPPGWDHAARLATQAVADRLLPDPALAARDGADSDLATMLPRAALTPPEAQLLRPGAAAPAATLAAAWRAQVLTTPPQRRFPGAGPAGPGGMQAPATAAAALPWSTLEFPLLGGTPAPAPAPVLPERPGWLLQAWDGRPLVLRLVEPEPEEPPAAGPARGLPALRLAVELPRLGRIVVQLQLAAGGVWLAMAVEREASLPWVQAALPALTQALSQAGLRLLRWRLERGSGHGSAFANLPLQLPPSATLLAPALFRAAAELVLVLQAVDAALPDD